jgi:hypothetical protein
LNKICFKSSKQLSTNFTQRYDHIIRFDSSASSVNGGSFHNTNKGYQNDTLNLYFMHPNENVALVLVTSLLSGSNYHLWSRSMIIELRSKNKLHFINRSLPRPLDEDHDSLAWNRCNTIIMSWLTNSVDLEFAQCFMEGFCIWDLEGVKGSFLSG